MKTLLSTLATPLALTLTLSLNANAKIGDTFIDPEFGEITVKGPSFENDKGVPVKIVDGEYVLIDTPQKVFVDKTNEVSFNFLKDTELLETDMTNEEIIDVTKKFITNFENLKKQREDIYINGYNPEMLMQYRAGIEYGQRAFKYKFLDYFMQIKGTPEFDKLKQEINFSSQIYKNLELYKES